MTERDIMAYYTDMEELKSDILEQVLSKSNACDFSTYTERHVVKALSADVCATEDFAALLSESAAPYLEEMAKKARSETNKHFGNSRYLFTPLYISNYCENQCVYCGFNRGSNIKRSRLNCEEIEEEMAAIAKSGLKEILILTGESRKYSDVKYVGEACRLAKKYFTVIGLEVYPMNVSDYAYLRECGADFVTVFQETYDAKEYDRLHPGGRKRIFPYRFYAQERAVLGGIRGVGFAALLGLADFRRDAYATGLHAFFLQRKYPHAEISFSCPRLRPAAGGEKIFDKNISEAQLLQIICAYRIFMPFAGITVSSRENSNFRDNVVNIAATKISAGVDVGIGGHSGESKGGEQFEIDDGRAVAQIYGMLKAQDLQPVMSEYIYL